jgi:hypothetical protein
MKSKSQSHRDIIVRIFENITCLNCRYCNIHKQMCEILYVKKIDNIRLTCENFDQNN